MEEETEDSCPSELWGKGEEGRVELVEEVDGSIPKEDNDTGGLGNK